MERSPGRAPIGMKPRIQYVRAVCRAGRGHSLSGLASGGAEGSELVGDGVEGPVGIEAAQVATPGIPWNLRPSPAHQEQAMRIGTYARISYIQRSSNVGTYLSPDSELGVGRQQDDTQALTKIRGWKLADSYTDNELSAYKRNVTRPDFERMLSDLESGAIQGIVVYDLDRLARQPADLERIIEIYDRKPLVFATVQGDIDLSTPDGRTMARVLVAFANKASMDTARRVARKKLEKATDGVGFSNYRPFGWNEDRLTLNEPEAQILRQAAADVLSGTGLFIICDRLNKRGIRTVRGNIWKSHAMRRVLSAPRIAGFAVYQGELLTDSSGKPIRGKWEPILDEATWRAVCEILSHRRNQKQRGETGLLTNIARCGKCGLGLHIARKTRVTLYVCRSSDSGGCSGVGINAPKLEAQVTALLFAYLKDREATDEQPAWPGQARLDEVSTKIGELMEQYRTGLDGKIVFPMVRQLEAERDELEAEQTKFTKTRARRNVTIDGEWDDLDLYAKRAVISSVIEAVVVKPVGRGVNRYNPDRVDVIPLG
jgi:site-specific DNA recombinase